jgi:hypothetical protein
MGRRFMVSENGLMALGPEEAQIRDCICIIPGHEVPLLLCPLGDSRYKLVGEIYVLRIMGGQVWN